MFLTLFALLGQFADLSSTLYKFKHGYKEGNPLFGGGSPTRIVLTKAAIIGIFLVANHLTPSPIVPIAVGLLGFIPAAFNLSKPNLS